MAWPAQATVIEKRKTVITEADLVMNKRILLISCFYYPELTGIGKFNGEMIEWLSLKGCDCSAVVPYPYYPDWKIQEPYKGNSYWYKFEKKIGLHKLPIKIYRCPHYVPSIPTGKKRILSDISFFFSAFFQVFILLFHKKYDYVITVSPAFHLGFLGLIHKKFKRSQLLYHIQDLQIDAACALGLIKSDLLVSLLMKLEYYILLRADCVSSISEGMIKKIKTKYNRPVVLLPNWADVKSFHPIEEKLEIRQRYNFSLNDKIVLYSGAIGEKQGLQNLLISAKELKDSVEIKFIICSNGPYIKKLADLAKKIDLSNVVFMPLQSREKLNEFLNIADLHIVLQKADANDLMMPSKLANIWSIGGLVLVSTKLNTSLHSIITINNIGLLIEQENQVSLTKGILKALDHTSAELRKNARRYAENHLAIDKVLTGFFSTITKWEIIEH